MCVGWLAGTKTNARTCMDTHLAKVDYRRDLALHQLVKGCRSDRYKLRWTVGGEEAVVVRRRRRGEVV